MPADNIGGFLYDPDMRFGIVTIWICLGILIAAGPATRPATIPTTAQAWVDRADRELPAVAVTRPSELPLGKAGLAIAIYRASPSDARRAAASAVIRAETRPTVINPPETDIERIEKLDHAACRLAQIDDVTAAAALLADVAKSPVNLEKEGGPDSRDFVWDGAFALIRLGRADEIGGLAISYAPLRLARTFRDCGRDDLADALLLEAHRTAGITGGSCEELADAGFFDEAMASAAGESKPQYVFDQQCRVASRALAAGNATYVKPVRQDMLAYLPSHPQELRSVQLLPRVLDLTVETGDRAGVTEIAGFYKNHRPRDVTEIEAEWILFSACIDVGMTDDARSHSERVEAAAAAAIADPQSDGSSRYSAAMRLAAVQARLGDVAAVDKTLAAIRDSIDPQSGRASLATYELVSAYAAAGRFDDAIRLTKAADPADYSWLTERIAGELAFAGRYERARQLFAEQDPLHRLFVEHYIAIRQIKRGDTAGLADWIDKVPTAAERCLLDVAVANVLSGRRNRDLEDHIRDIGPHRPG